MSRVSLVRCVDYDPQRVDAAVRRAVELLGGMGAYVRPGQRVLLKPNLVRPVPPERAVCTHPTVVAAVARLVVEAGGHPVIVESPGGPYSEGVLRSFYRKTEMVWAAEAGGAELNYDVEAVQVSHPDAQLLHRLDLVKPLTEVDVVINLPKLKTHNLTGLTMAVKNLFGLVPGALKIGYHAKMQERERFAHGLLDIYTYVRPALNLMDAVVAMEGDGPSGGDPRPMGALVAGADSLAVDVAGAALVGFEPMDVLTTQIAVERGLTRGRPEDIEWLGDAPDTVRLADFRRGTASEIDPGLLPRALRGLLRMEPSGEGDARGRGVFRILARGWVWRQLISLPRAGSECTGCGYCARHCPVNAIEITNGRAHMDTSRCIRCYCCHELCPELAVELYRPLLGRLIMGS